jgi:hypothetical protein
MLENATRQTGMPAAASCFSLALLIRLPGLLGSLEKYRCQKNLCKAVWKTNLLLHENPYEKRLAFIRSSRSPSLPGLDSRFLLPGPGPPLQRNPCLVHCISVSVCSDPLALHSAAQKAHRKNQTAIVNTHQS